MLQLTQKERLYITDAMHHEETCVRKYNDYAEQVKCQELKTMFNQHAQQEQQHYDTLNQILQGVVPNMGQGQQQQNQQQNMSQQQNNQPVSQSSTFNQEEAFYCQDLLSTEKYISGIYDTFIFETSNPQIRQALQHIQKDEQKHGEDIFNYMKNHGMYNVQ